MKKFFVKEAGKDVAIVRLCISILFSVLGSVIQIFYAKQELLGEDIKDINEIKTLVHVENREHFNRILIE